MNGAAFVCTSYDGLHSDVIEWVDSTQLIRYDWIGSGFLGGISSVTSHEHRSSWLIGTTIENFITAQGFMKRQVTTILIFNYYIYYLETQFNCEWDSLLTRQIIEIKTIGSGYEACGKQIQVYQSSLWYDIHWSECKVFRPLHGGSVKSRRTNPTYAFQRNHLGI